MSPTLQTLIPVAAGITVVIVGILVFKLHAFLALILAAAVTAAMTPDYVLNVETLRKQGHVGDFIGIERPRSERDRKRFKVQYVIGHEGTPSGGGSWCVIDPRDYVETGRIKAVIWNSGYTTRRPYGRERPTFVGRLTEGHFSLRSSPILVPSRSSAPSPGLDAAIEASERHRQLAYDAPLTEFYRPGPTDILIRAEYVGRLEISPPTVPARIAAAFGDTVGSIGLLIAFAAVIGMCLLDSGAADRIVRSALNVVGERGSPIAFAGCGFLLGVPVFFDTVFLLMIPLGKAMHLRTGRNYILYVLTIVCGATMAHSLVPPTPGPLLVAEALDVEVGMMMFVGGIVGLITATYGILHALVVNRLMTVPLRDTPEVPLKDLEQLAARPDHELPPLWLSLLPIVLPVWLIAQQTALGLFLKNPPAPLAGFAASIPAYLVTAVNVLGEKNTAVGIGVAIGLFLLAWQTRQSLGQMRDRVGAALASGGVIILITAAGGAFGDMLEQTGVAALLKQMPKMGPAGLLTVAFLVTTAIRTAQGSATVAMITAVGLFAGIEVPFHPVWLAVAIGCGSKPISWMTDSGFWVICKMSGMTEIETLKTLTPMTAIMGVLGLVVVIVGATLFPMK